MSPEETASMLRRLERKTFWLYLSGVSMFQGRYSPCWPALRFILGAVCLLFFIRLLWCPVLIVFGSPEEFASQGIETFTAFYVIGCLIYFGMTHEERKRSRHKKPFRSLNGEIDQVLGYVKLEHLDLVCQIHRNADGLLWTRVRERLEDTTANLLMRPGTEEICLSNSSVDWLKYQADCGTNSFLRVAALIALKDRDVEGLSKVALHASQSIDDRVRAAAMDVLANSRGVQ